MFYSLKHISCNLKIICGDPLSTQKIEIHVLDRLKPLPLSGLIQQTTRY